MEILQPIFRRALVGEICQQYDTKM